MFRITLILSLLIFVACNTKENQTPKGVLPFNEMSDVMLDVQLLESHLNSERMMNPYISDSITGFYNSVFKKHNITKNVYDSSMMYYASNITLLDSLYNNVFAKLQEMELELQDVSYETPNLQYYTKQELLNHLNKLSIKEYLIRDNVSFIHAKDSLNKFIITNESEMDSLDIQVIKLKNSFNIYSNSTKRMRELQEELRKME